MNRLRAIASHTALAVAEAGLVALLAVGLIAGTTFAAKGGASAGGTSTAIKMVALDGWANHGDQITFTVTTSNPYPVASLSCSQGGTVVYGDSRPMYTPNIWNDPGIFTLSSIAWASGAADCHADLKGTSHGKIVILGSTNFHVDP